MGKIVNTGWNEIKTEKICKHTTNLSRIIRKVSRRHGYRKTFVTRISPLPEYGRLESKRRRGSFLDGLLSPPPLLRVAFELISNKFFFHTRIRESRMTVWPLYVQRSEPFRAYLKVNKDKSTKCEDYNCRGTMYSVSKFEKQFFFWLSRRNRLVKSGSLWRLVISYVLRRHRILTRLCFEKRSNRFTHSGRKAILIRYTCTTNWIEWNDNSIEIHSTAL